MKTTNTRTIIENAMNAAGIAVDSNTRKTIIDILADRLRPAAKSMWENKNGLYVCPSCENAYTLPTGFCSNCGEELSGITSTDDRGNLVIAGYAIPDFDPDSNDLWRERRCFSTASIRADIRDIGNYAFAGCNIPIITIDGNLTRIGIGAFKDTVTTDVYCYADPATLTWEEPSNSFLKDNPPVFHVKKEHYAAYCEKFADANVKFEGDLNN